VLSIDTRLSQTQTPHQPNMLAERRWLRAEALQFLQQGYLPEHRIRVLLLRANDLRFGANMWVLRLRHRHSRPGRARCPRDVINIQDDRFL
jgi:hypothetical protein